MRLARFAYEVLVDTGAWLMKRPAVAAFILVGSWLAGWVVGVMR